MSLTITPYTPEDLPAITEIWNEVVTEGVAFPQTNPLSMEEANAFFAAQTLTACARQDGQILGMYILHPNNVGRCGHIANASYAVSSGSRGLHIGEALVMDCLARAREHGYKILQFNAVVDNNLHARHLYERLGFTDLGTIPSGFLMPDGHYEDIHVMYHLL